MKKVFTTLLISASFAAAGAAHASSESAYPFPDNAVSPVQQNLVVEQDTMSNNAYPAVLVRSTANRSDVLRDLAAYRDANRVDEHLYSGS